jgi:hypothetical protein
MDKAARLRPIRCLEASAISLSIPASEKKSKLPSARRNAYQDGASGDWIYTCKLTERDRDRVRVREPFEVPENGTGSELGLGARTRRGAIRIVSGFLNLYTSELKSGEFGKADATDLRQRSDAEAAQLE